MSEKKNAYTFLFSKSMSVLKEIRNRHRAIAREGAILIKKVSKKEGSEQNGESIYIAK